MLSGLRRHPGVLVLATFTPGLDTRVIWSAGRARCDGQALGVPEAGVTVSERSHGMDIATRVPGISVDACGAEIRCRGMNHGVDSAVALADGEAGDSPTCQPCCRSLDGADGTGIARGVSGEDTDAGAGASADGHIDSARQSRRRNGQ